MYIKLIDLGRVSFQQAYSKQLNIHRQVLQGKRENTLILCEHPSTITLSRKSTTRNILDPKPILNKEVDFIIGVDRGGDITYHGPGQLMGYLIFDLRKMGRDLGLFIDRIEESIICTLSSFGIVSGSRYGLRGVWVGDKKIASMGIGVHKWVTMHGLGLNINTDLSYFEILRPCGMDIKMTSMSEILGESVDMGLVKEELVKQVLIGFGNKFSYSGGVKVRS